MPQRYNANHKTRLKEAIEAKLAWGSSANWSTKDFQNLSDHIESSTGVLLSVSTLKRFFGTVKADSQPSASTLDTLSIFLGYQSWRIFSEQNFDAAAKPEPGFLSRINQFFRQSPIYFPYGRFLILFSLLIGVALISGFFIRPEPINLDTNQISFEIKKVSTGLPNTVVFKYDIGDLPYEDLQIQQSWDESMRISLDAPAAEKAILYQYPGYYNAKLVINGQIVAERDLYIASNDWLGAIEFSDGPRYLLDEDLTRDGALQANSSVVNEIEKNETFEWMSLFYLKEFEEMEARDFHLKTAFRNTMRHGNNICQKTKIRLVGTSGAISLHFSIPGCVAENRIYLSGNFIEGNTNDLSDFGCDFSSFIPIEVMKEGNEVSVWRADKMILKDTLAFDLGRIAGLSYHFKGAGAIEYVELESKSVPLIQQNFGNDNLEEIIN